MVCFGLWELCLQYTQQTLCESSSLTVDILRRFYSCCGNVSPLLSSDAPLIPSLPPPLPFFMSVVTTSSVIKGALSQPPRTTRSGPQNKENLKY